MKSFKTKDARDATENATPSTEKGPGSAKQTLMIVGLVVLILAFVLFYALRLKA